MKETNESKKMKILICDPLDAEGMDIFRKEGKFTLIDAIGKPTAELKKTIRDASAVVVRSGTKLTAELIGEARSLRIIGRAGVGLDNVDVEAASKRGIVECHGGSRRAAVRRTDGGFDAGPGAQHLARPRHDARGEVGPQKIHRH